MRRLGRIALVLAGLGVAAAFVEGAFRFRFTPAEMVAFVAPPGTEPAAHWVDHPFLPIAGRPEAQ